MALHFHFFVLLLIILEMSTIERYVPIGNKSLSSDAPGWSFHSQISEEKILQNESIEEESGIGPICWKCKGRKSVSINKKFSTKKLCSKNDIEDIINEGDQSCNSKKIKYDDSENENFYKPCTVCDGKGFIVPKKKEISSLSSKPGMITWKRKYPTGWRCSGPVADGVKLMEEYMKNDSFAVGEDVGHPLYILHKANSNDPNDDNLQDKEGISISSIGVKYEDFPWFPSGKGEQLCNLVGTWRILQRVGSHRWTTDDIVTAYFAINEILSKEQQSSNRRKQLRYLDLGCGNGSVLQMTSWGLMEEFDDFKAFGIEARSEAANLARRSLSFNIGKNNVGKCISVIRADFRDLERNDIPFESIVEGFDNDSNQLKDFSNIMSQKSFDLITGTPPYFQVDFQTVDLSNGKCGFDRAVTSAIINQGGMPTSIQSAPARCEFRGGIEAYCNAAAKVLSNDGIFVVCENWLNNERVYLGAEVSGLKIVKVYPIKGKSTKKEILFGVYVLMKNSKSDNSCIKNTVVQNSLSVRSDCGKWTLAYAELLEKMSIPSKHMAI